MNELIQIRLVSAYNNVEENKRKLTVFFSKIVEKAIEWDIWDIAIKTIIISDDFMNEVYQQADKWNTKSHISQEKEYRVASKILFNNNRANPEYHIFFDYRYVQNENYPIIHATFGQILNISANKIFPIKTREYVFNYRDSSLDDYVKFASTEWCIAVYTRAFLGKLNVERSPLMNQNTFLTTFKRKLKKNLFEYNSDKVEEGKKLDLFWYNYFESLNTLFLRLIENESNETDFQIKQSEPCRDLVYSVTFEIGELTKKCLDQEDYDITNLREAIKRFSEHFDIFLEHETDQNFAIRLTKNPKDYFVDEIVETEPRIICFMDILGFSELINEYDNDITSTVLQDIQESFALAKTELLENKTHQNNEFVRHLKYQTFSDNICISIPYFDNENDFLVNFSLLITYVKGFQSIMMTKGFFTRGGISAGSYYADNNIIFSKGLVNAYQLESKKAVYPRVVIDKIILERLWKYNFETIKYFGIDIAIIFDWENTAFLNPFGILHSSIKQFESLFKELNSDDDEPLTKALNTLTRTVSEMTVGLLKSVEENEKKGMQLIKDKITENIYLHEKNENIVSKYWWLFELVKWIEKDESAKLQFQFMSEFLNRTGSN